MPQVGLTHLSDDEDCTPGTQLTHIPIHARDHICHSLPNGDQNSQQFLGPVPDQARQLRNSMLQLTLAR